MRRGAVSDRFSRLVAPLQAGKKLRLNRNRRGANSLVAASAREAVQEDAACVYEERGRQAECTAVPGFEAVEKAKKLRPNVILMDTNMPRIDGAEATRIIRRELPECNVIVVTQNHVSIAREQAVSAGAHGFVTKSAVAAAGIAKVLFFIFLALFIVSLIFGRRSTAV